MGRSENSRLPNSHQRSLAYRKQNRFRTSCSLLASSLSLRLSCIEFLCTPHSFRKFSVVYPSKLSSLQPEYGIAVKLSVSLYVSKKRPRTRFCGAFAICFCKRIKDYADVCVHACLLIRRAFSSC